LGKGRGFGKHKRGGRVIRRKDECRSKEAKGSKLKAENKVES